MTGEIQQVLYPETTVTRRLPLNLRDENHFLFDNELQRTIPQTTLVELRDVRIGPEGILFKGFEVLAQSFAFPANYKQWKLRSHVKFFANNYLLRRTRDFEPTVLWITDDWSGAYFHWLTDVLSRLYVVREGLDELVLVLPHWYDRLEYVHSSLRCFNLKSLEFIGPNEVLRCRKVVLPSHTAPSGHYNEQIIREVRAIVLAAYGDHSQANDRIYISRGRAGRRRIGNEEPVADLLRDYGFQIVYTEDLSFQRQVEVCSRARYLVSNHGAGLTNMLFAPEGANILELRHHRDDINNCYFTLASALNQNYFFQACQTASGNDEPHLADLVVDLNVLEENLRLLTTRN
jgi:capsular polysaccharide biosynthesis protein